MMVGMGLLFSLAMLIFWIWSLVDCLTNKRLTEAQRVMWTLLIIFLHPLSSLIYVLVGRYPKVYVPPQPYYYPPQTYHQAQAEVAQPPAESYPAYQEGYRVQNTMPPQQPPASPVPMSENVQPEQKQTQYEEIQISYPE